METQAVQASGVEQAGRYGPLERPLLLEGEVAAAYEELSARSFAALRPGDVIEEMLVADIVALHWQILRWRRLQSTLINAGCQNALESFLFDELDYRDYRRCFELKLAELLAEKFETEQAQDLARRYAWSEPEGAKKVETFLQDERLDVDTVLDYAKRHVAEKLARAFAQGKPSKRVRKLLASRGRTIDGLIIDALIDGDDHLADVERLDRLITITETRRNSMLRELDRRRAGFGDALLKKMRIEDDHLKSIEPHDDAEQDDSD
jgi:hypothetical protein